MYPSAICKTSDKSVENSTRLKKIILVVPVLVLVKRDVFTNRLKLQIKKQITMSHLIKLTNNSCMCGMEIIRLSKCHYFALFSSIS